VVSDFVAQYNLEPSCLHSIKSIEPELFGEEDELILVIKLKDGTEVIAYSVDVAT